MLPTPSDEDSADRLENRLADVETAISQLFSSANASSGTLASRLRDVELALAECRSRLDHELSQSAEACDRLEQKLCDAEVAHDELRTEQSWALSENERLAQREAVLSSQLDASRSVIRRQFEESPLAICRCTSGGALTDANRAFILLVGHESLDQLRKTDFAALVFESAADLPWLIERCINASATATIETTWKTREGNHLIVRLSATERAHDAIEIVVEDLTALRTLQERLGPAQRMEAVGRLASEVAVTCANLLDDVHQDAESWLKNAGTDASLQHRAEMLLEEITRAGGFLRQLAAYGDEQVSALSRVDLNKMLRDLGSVLKNVAGDDVELELPRGKVPLTADLRSDRVERLLVNLARYGRERMPFGGRLKIELATVIVDQAFMEKYPNVRRGQHALITMTGRRRAARAEGPLGLRELPAETEGHRESSGSLGVDLGALQALIQECSGHLWVTAVPGGDMVVEIRLPLCPDAQLKLNPAAAQQQPAPAAARAGLGLTSSSLVSR